MLQFLTAMRIRPDRVAWIRVEPLLTSASEPEPRYRGVVFGVEVGWGMRESSWAIELVAYLESASGR
ncbi:hypothetical protein D1J51_10510 [Leucobacter sp. wl10]|nr:hypothetical protein D1J51_10510 [Leucobacter sp. wl10]